MLLRGSDLCTVRVVFPQDSSLPNMATKTTQLSVKNLLEKPISIQCCKPFMMVKTACSWNSTKKNHTGKKVIQFRDSSSSVFRSKSYNTMQGGWHVNCVLDSGANSDRGDSTVNEEIPRTSALGSTRLGRIIRAGTGQFFEKINGARRKFPMKIFLLLLGYYTANALATILGQTGDWDVLVAGIVVAAIEGIGILMYKKPLPIGKLHPFIVMVNYWKAGLCLGLFVDAFKLGS